MKVKIAFAAICLLLFASTSFAYDKAVTFVRNGSFTKCKYKSIGESIDEAFEKPSWESGKSTDGELIVNAQGIVTWQGKRYRVLMQFSPQPGGAIKTNGVSFNGQEMGQKFLTEFVTELCK
jgi:hypothetical protein